jgi:hypothetical protein
LPTALQIAHGSRILIANILALASSDFGTSNCIE